MPNLIHSSHQITSNLKPNFLRVNTLMSDYYCRGMITGNAITPTQTKEVHSRIDSFLLNASAEALISSVALMI